MKHQISSIIVTPPKIIGRMFCQSQLMSPVGERMTLMVISSLPGTKCSVAKTKADRAGRQPWGWGGERPPERGSCLPRNRVPASGCPSASRSFLTSFRVTASWH